MSARPHLVEEGTPIYGGVKKKDGKDMDIDNHRQSSSSSLARAAGKSSNKSSADSSPKVTKKPFHLTTRLVVGGEEEDDHDDDKMVIDHHHETHQRGHAASHTSHHYTHHHKSSTSSHHYVIGGGGVPHHLPASPHQHHYTIGEDEHVSDDRIVERMEGVEDHGSKMPLVVMDGANIAYAYADVMAGLEGTSSSLGDKARRREPDARGISVAAKYFMAAGIRVLVVVPTPWLRAKPRAGDSSKENSLMLTPQLEVLQDLKTKGLLVAAPPTDDDDAYCILIARREDSRAKKRGGGFCLSNDMFRDAVHRDGGVKSGELYQWLKVGSGNGPGRISFAFCDMGSMDEHGDREMDFVPNPRHKLVSWIESHHRSNNLAAS